MGLAVLAMWLQVQGRQAPLTLLQAPQSHRFLLLLIHPRRHHLVGGMKSVTMLGRMATS